MAPFWIQVTLGIYAALLAIGGIIGFTKARSRTSLIAGLASALVALAALVAVGRNPEVGASIGALLSLLLLGMFVPRFVRSRKVMPAGLMVVASLVVLVLMIVSLADDLA